MPQTENEGKPDDHYWDGPNEYSAKGPFVVWLYYGYEGWQPRSYPTLEAALCAERSQSEFVITKIVKFDVVERSE